MHYMGSKAKHAKDIIAIMMPERRPDQFYCEPFVGGGNVINKVPHGAGRMANDKNFAMIALLDALGNKGWEPPTSMDEATHRKLMKKKNKLEGMDWPEMALFAFAATGLTFGSKWCEGYVKEEQRCRQAHDACMEAAPGLKDIVFTSGSYDKFVMPPQSMVYCDPPYVGTAGYIGSTTTIKVGEKDHNIWRASDFWRWADGLADAGCSVFVSEYTGPDGSMFNVKPTSEQKDALAAARAAHKALDPTDASIPSAAFEEASQRVRDVEAAIRANGDAQAAKWQVLWEKEVISDFSPVREAGVYSGKREMEKLFHRVP